MCKGTDCVCFLKADGHDILSLRPLLGPHHLLLCLADTLLRQVQMAGDLVDLTLCYRSAQGAGDRAGPHPGPLWSGEGPTGNPWYPRLG